VLTHAIEAYTSLIANPYTDAVALETIRMAAKWLPVVFDDGRNIEARAQMLMASCMAAIAFNVTGLGVCHGTGHPLSARLGSAHGQTLAAMLPHVMRFNRSVCGEKYTQVGAALGVEASADAAIAEVEAIRARIGLKKTIKELGGNADLIEALSDDAMADLTTRTNARKVERSDAKALYEAALNL
ncbi:MAG: iron-containing alcohol dehydrogenase, partial [Candidatus Hydrogenedentota bacterium]